MVWLKYAKPRDFMKKKNQSVIRTGACLMESVSLLLMHCTALRHPHRGNGLFKLVEVALLWRPSHSFPFQHGKKILYHMAIYVKSLLQVTPSWVPCWVPTFFFSYVVSRLCSLRETKKHSVAFRLPTNIK